MSGVAMSGVRSDAVQQETGSDLFSSFGPRDRLAQLRRLIQDAIDVFEGLVMAHEERYRESTEPELRVEGAEAPAEISLPDLQGRTAIHAH